MKDAAGQRRDRRRWVVPGAVGAIVLAASVGAVAWLRVPMPPDPPVRETPKVEQPHPKRRFQCTSIADGRDTTTGATATGYSYRTSDGVLLSVVREDCPSRAAARRSVATAVRDARAIVERGTMCDSGGRVVGERVRFLLSPSDSDEPRARLVYPVDRVVYTVASVTLGYVQEFDEASPSREFAPCDAKSPE